MFRLESYRDSFPNARLASRIGVLEAELESISPEGFDFFTPRGL